MNIHTKKGLTRLRVILRPASLFRAGRVEGLALAELVVSVLLFMFIVAGLFTALLAGNKSWQTYGATVRAQQEVRKAISWMSRDLRIAQNLPAGTGSISLPLTFSQPGVGTVTYSWVTTGAQANRIIRQTATRSWIVANKISAFSVSQTADDITVNVTATVASSRVQNSTFQLAHKMAKVARRL
jgi:Tfp pilus assembly protein PilW